MLADLAKGSGVTFGKSEIAPGGDCRLRLAVPVRGVGNPPVAVGGAEAPVGFSQSDARKVPRKAAVLGWLNARLRATCRLLHN